MMKKAWEQRMRDTANADSPRDEILAQVRKTAGDSG
jgi:hypothetical protein